MMSPYAFHQFWLNVEDEKVGELLRIFTFLTREEIEDLEAADGGEAVPAGGPEGARRRRDHRGARARSRPSTPRPLPRRCSAAATCASCAPRPWPPPCARREPPRPTKGTGVVDLLVASGLAKSKGEARRTITEGGAYLNNERITDVDHVPGDDDLLGGSWLVLRRGKKNLAGVAARLTSGRSELDARESPVLTGDSRLSRL